MLTAPSIMLRALQLGEDGSTGPEACLKRVLGDLHQAKEPAPHDLTALRESIRGVFETLLAAQLLDYDGWGRFSLTPRGKRVLRDHPWGVDSSVLEAFPEYLSFLRQKGQKPGGPNTVDEPKPQHSEGYAAFISGKGLDANPYEFDSAAHLEWENGWGEASKTRSGAWRNQEPKPFGARRSLGSSDPAARNR